MNYSDKALSIPPEFNGQAQLILYTRYGDPRECGWEGKWMSLWHVGEAHPWFPEKSIYVHKHFRPLLDAAFTELAGLGLHEEIQTMDCAHHLRYLNQGKGVLSVHSWGAAIDLNASLNLLGSTGSWSDGFIAAMMRHSICCGQTWQGRPHPMHFAMVDG